MQVRIEEQPDGVTLVTVDRPPANALDVTLIGEIVTTFEALAGDPPPAVVLAGRPGMFSAGADLKAIPTYGPAEQRASVEGINAMVVAVYGLGCPVVGAITGHAIAGGFVLALCADLRIAAPGRCGLTEIKVGVPYPQAAMRLVQAELAPHAARRLALGSELTSAEECLALGAFDELHDDGEAALARALELAASLAAMPRDVYARTKRDLRAPTLAAMRKSAAADPLLERWVS